MRRTRNKKNRKGTLLSDVIHFYDASLQGDYYESFKVNSRNFMEKSPGTEEWIEECEDLFRRCLSSAEKSDPVDARKAFGLLFDLLGHVDAGHDDVVFWADEGGLWEIDIDWKKVLPAWFRCLSQTAGPEEYAQEALRVIDAFVYRNRDLYLKKARAAAKPEQKKALKDLS